MVYLMFANTITTKNDNFKLDMCVNILSALAVLACAFMSYDVINYSFQHVII